MIKAAVTKVCPACLEEQQYERLYWNVRLILLCPRHQILLVDRCPRCVRMIPALLRTVVTECPYCRRGDYRAAACLRIAPDTLLSQGQHVLLQMLGVEEFGSEEIPTRTLAAPLATLKPWQYMDLLDSFGSVVPFLRPERALAACNRKLGFSPPPLARASPGDRRRMVHVSLFQALLLSWPGQGDMLLDSSSLSSEPPIDQSQGNQTYQGTGTELYTQLFGLFESQKQEGRRQVSLHQRWGKG